MEVGRKRGDERRRRVDKSGIMVRGRYIDKGKSNRRGDRRKRVKD